MNVRRKFNQLNYEYALLSVHKKYEWFVTKCFFKDSLYVQRSSDIWLKDIRASDNPKLRTVNAQYLLENGAICNYIVG